MVIRNKVDLSKIVIKSWNPIQRTPSSIQSNRRFNFFDDFFSDLKYLPFYLWSSPIHLQHKKGGKPRKRGGSAQQPFRSDHANKLLNSHKVLLKSSALTSLTSLVVEILSPVIGRDEEIIRVIEILNRRTKNNPQSSSVNQVSVRLLSLKV